jgi:hypothetical protein
LGWENSVKCRIFFRVELPRQGLARPRSNGHSTSAGGTVGSAGGCSLKPDTCIAAYMALDPCEGGRRQAGLAQQARHLAKGCEQTIASAAAWLLM